MTTPAPTGTDAVSLAKLLIETIIQYRSARMIPDWDIREAADEMAYAGSRLCTYIAQLGEDDDSRYLCDGCGRVGTVDDYCADGEDCLGEECDGTVHRIKED